MILYGHKKKKSKQSVVNTNSDAIKHLPFGSPLARKLLLSMLFCSSVLALLITAFEVHDDYVEGTESIRSRQDAIINSFSEPLIRSIWGVNTKQSSSLLQAIVAWEQVDYVELQRDLGDKLTAGVKPDGEKITSISPLLYQSTLDQKPVKLGHLQISSSVLPLYGALISETLKALCLNALKSFLTFMLAAVLFWQLITRHLMAISHFLSSGHWGQKADSLILLRSKSDITDELDIIVSSLNNANQEIFQYQEDSRKQQLELQKELTRQSESLQLAHERLLAQERLATIGSLVAMVAHELRNPLGAIRASTTLLRASARSKSHSPEEKVISRIERCINRCDRIIEEMRSIGTGRVPDLQKIPYAHWLQKELDKVESLDGVRLDFQAGTEASVFLDKSSFLQILHNLLENARQASIAKLEKTSTRPLIRLKLTQEHDKVHLDIMDQGGGLSKKSLEMAFEPLYTTKIYGFGMGLAIARRHTAIHGGSLAISNNQDGGATVRLTLPCADSPSVGTDQTLT